MSLGKIFMGLFEQEPKKVAPVPIPYIDLQRGFQLFVPQLYYISPTSNPDAMEQIIPESALRHFAPTHFSSGRTEFSQIGNFMNENGGGIFFGECKASQIEQKPKDLLYIFLCTLSYNEERGGIRPVPHFLFLGEMCPKTDSSLAVLPLLMACQAAHNNGVTIELHNQTAISNSLSIANHIFLSILANVPVDMDKIFGDFIKSHPKQQKTFFSDMANSRTLETLENDIAAVQQGKMYPFLATPAPI